VCNSIAFFFISVKVFNLFPIYFVTSRSKPFNKVFISYLFNHHLRPYGYRLFNIRSQYIPEISAYTYLRLLSGFKVLINSYNRTFLVLFQTPSETLIVGSFFILGQVFPPIIDSKQCFSSSNSFIYKLVSIV